MIDFEARKIVEALRSGVSSRAAGQYFTGARQGLLRYIADRLNEVCDSKTSTGIIISGKYGEGKTHFLNTVFNMAHSENMVVSRISMGKETPFNQLHLVYKSLISNTYLPGRFQPGFIDALSGVTPNSPVASELLTYAAKHLEVDKFYYLFKSYLSTDDINEKFIIQSDMEGDFMNISSLRSIYKRLFGEKVVYNVNFSKTKHMRDYFSMINRLFLALGYSGWVILFDETELIGGMAKGARLKAYSNMHQFLFPEDKLLSTFSIFAITDSYLGDVIESKHEFANLSESKLTPEEQQAAETVLRAMISAKQLQPLNNEEIIEVMEKLIVFYKNAYDWQADIDVTEIIKRTENRGYLLRTRIRACVEYLDQLYQYNEASEIKINQLGKISYEEDDDDSETPSQDTMTKTEDIF